MSIELKYTNSAQSKNKIFIFSSLSDIESFEITKEEKEYFKKKLKQDNFAYNLNNGIYQIMVKNNTLTDSFEDKENIRKTGNKTFELINNEVKDCQIYSTNEKELFYFLEGFCLSAYQFDKYLKEKSKSILSTVYYNQKKLNLALLNILIDSTFWARDLVNEPVSSLNAEKLATEIKSKCTSAGLKVEILKKSKISALKMGGILAVNQGSIDTPTFTIIEWKPKNAKNKKPIILVGKGVVYDTGGLSLKPTAGSMDSMKSDMGGAATMASTIYAAAKLNLPLHIVGLIPATDNRPGGNAYAPGDIITMFDGTTVEILNTDAEGRMILADALAYAKKYKPEIVIDAATLTGSAYRAFGTFTSVGMGNASEKEMKLLEKAGYETNDKITFVPFWDDYKEEMKSSIADLNNLGGPNAGMITAGKFLEHFTDYPYVHIDIAGTAFLDKKNTYLPKGGTGSGVRLLVEYLIQKSK